jgi:hypothetical protein
MHIGAGRGYGGYQMGPNWINDTTRNADGEHGVRWGPSWGPLYVRSGSETVCFEGPGYTNIPALAYFDEMQGPDSDLSLGVTFSGIEWPVPHWESKQADGTTSVYTSSPASPFVRGRVGYTAAPCFVRAGDCWPGSNASYYLNRDHPIGLNGKAFIATLYGDVWDDSVFTTVPCGTLGWAVGKSGNNPQTMYGTATWTSDIGAGNNPSFEFFRRQDINVAAASNRNWPITIRLGVTGSVGSGPTGVTSLPNFIGRACQIHLPFADRPNGWCVSPHSVMSGLTLKEQTDDIVNSPAGYLRLLLQMYRDTMGSTEAERNLGTMCWVFTSWQNEPNGGNSGRNGWGGSNPMDTAEGIRDCMQAAIEAIRAQWAIIGGTTELLFIFEMGHRHSSDVNDTTPANYGNIRYGTTAGSLGPIVAYAEAQSDVILVDGAHPKVVDTTESVIDTVNSDTAHLSTDPGFPLIARRKREAEGRAVRSNGKRTRVRRRINR